MVIDILMTNSAPPVRLDAAQIIVRNNQGTVVLAASDFGFDGAIKVARAGDPDFAAALRSLGVGDVVKVTPVILPLQRL